MRTIIHHYAFTLEEINERKCHHCDNIEFNKESGHNPQDNAPGNYIQHEDKFIQDLGWVRIFECNNCHNLLFFRSYYDEEVELIK